MTTKKKRSSHDSKLFDSYYTVTQFAKKHCVTPQAIRKAIKEGRIEATKLGHYWLIRRPHAN
jgi:excisionase family DNA binding protein